MILSQRSPASTDRTVLPPNTRFQEAPSATARMKSSVTRTDRLKFVRWPGVCFAVTNCSISGWSHRRVAIIAPRRDPADMIVRHIASHTSMNDTGPEASAPTPFTGKPLGRKVEKS